MDQADTILARFPGPVTLTPGRRKFVAVFAVCLGFTAFCVYLLMSGRLSEWQDMIMAWLASALFGVASARGLILLLVPSAAGLTLDDIGFTTGGIFRRRRFAWRDVSGFHLQPSEQPGKDPTIVYSVRRTGAPSQPRNASTDTRTLPDSYGPPRDDLVWLMNEWRQQALAQKVVRMR